MSNEDNQTVVKPEIILLENLLDEITQGRLRIPKFQRPFVWRPEQMTDLFDSIDRSFPIGSLLIWETNLPLASLDKIADFKIPPPPKDSRVSYLLDGHQRLSTLYGCLRRSQEPSNETGQSSWMWEVFRALGEQGDRNQFRHWKKPTSPPPENYLPMRSVLRTMDFLSFARRLEESEKFQENVSELINEAEELAQRFKSYQMAAVRLVGGDLKRAVRVFSRLNNSGQSMSPDQMVSALTYKNDNSESLAERISTIQEDVASTGFGTIPSMTIFRAILAVAGEEDVQEARWEVLADRVREGLAEYVDATEIALYRAIDFLRKTVGVPLARLVPYNAQIMLLVAFFEISPNPSPAKLETLVKWFWSTSWSGYFAGANTTQIKLILQEMKAFAGDVDSLDLDGQVARPFPDRFDMRSARIRSFMIWELQIFDNRIDQNGDKIDAISLLAQSDTGAYRHIITRGEGVSNPANRIILPTSPGMSTKRTLLTLSGRQGTLMARSHGIPDSALEKLHQGDNVGFINDRALYLARQEREFMSRFDVVPAEKLSADADIDTE
ncbi:DUF262 domain-containing protein [Amycolatopsis sp. SB7-3]|uniref:DUF262 domain-containing protein n=1 Tax=Amycolatopsis sp. SB7-3 TaxID=3373438 RepID=UPI0037446347